MKWAQSKAANIKFSLRSFVFAFFLSPVWRLARQVFLRFENVYIFSRATGIIRVCLHLNVHIVISSSCARVFKQKKRRPRVFMFMFSTWKDGEHTVSNYYKLSFELLCIQVLGGVNDSGAVYRWQWHRCVLLSAQHKNYYRIEKTFNADISFFRTEHEMWFRVSGVDFMSLL